MKKLVKNPWFILISLVMVGYGVFCLGYVANEKLNSQTQPVQAQTALNPDEVFALVNQERIKQGLKPLQRDARLDATAQMKLNQLVVDNSIEHIDKNGKHGYEYILENYPGLCKYVSENLAWRGSTGVSTVNAWMNSKPHHDAILDSKYSLSGIAVNGDKVVQHFCQTK